MCQSCYDNPIFHKLVHESLFHLNSMEESLFGLGKAFFEFERLRGLEEVEKMGASYDFAFAASLPEPTRSEILAGIYQILRLRRFFDSVVESGFIWEQVESEIPRSESSSVIEKLGWTTEFMRTIATPPGDTEIDEFEEFISMLNRMGQRRRGL